MKRTLMVGLVILSGCNGSDVQTQSVSTQIQSSVSAPTSTSSTQTVSDAKTTPMNQKYVYAIIGGKINNFPIDSTTGALVTNGGGVVSSLSVSLPNFYGMIMDVQGKFIYALDKTGGNYYVFSLPDPTASYNPYTANSFLTYVGFSAAGATPDSLAWGSNQHLFIRVSTTYAYEMSQNTSTGALTYISHTPTLLASSAESTYGFSFSGMNVSSVTNDVDTYTIDTQSNMILHYQNGVLEGSTQGYTSGTITSLILK